MKAFLKFSKNGIMTSLPQQLNLTLPISNFQYFHVSLQSFNISRPSMWLNVQEKLDTSRLMSHVCHAHVRLETIRYISVENDYKNN